MKLLDGKICIVTGAAGSLGLATAELFLRERSPECLRTIVGV